MFRSIRKLRTSVRIFMVRPVMTFLSGGERLCYDTGRALQSGGHDLRVLSSNFEPEKLEKVFGYGQLFARVNWMLYKSIDGSEPVWNIDSSPSSSKRPTKIAPARAFFTLLRIESMNSNTSSTTIQIMTTDTGLSDSVFRQTTRELCGTHSMPISQKA